MQYRSLLVKLSSILGLLTLALVGCSGPNGTASSSFAGSETCKHNIFLQKYGCDVIRIEGAANSGDPDAEYALGYLYYYGIGIPPDKQTALVWINKAAAQDQPLAKSALLIMEDSGVKQVIPAEPLSVVERMPAVAVTPGAVAPAAEDATVYKLNNQAPTQPLSSQLPAYNAENAPSAAPANGSADNTAAAAAAANSQPATSAQQPVLDVLQSHPNTNTGG